MTDYVYVISKAVMKRQNSLNSLGFKLPKWDVRHVE